MEKKDLRIVYMGTPEFAVDVFTVTILIGFKHPALKAGIS